MSLGVEFFGYAHISAQFCEDHKIDIEAHAINNKWFFEKGHHYHTISKTKSHDTMIEELQALPVGETKAAIKSAAKELKKKMPAKFGFAPIKK